MPIEVVCLNIVLHWIRPMTKNQLPYRWGDPLGKTLDPIWNRRSLIYRWLRQSDGAVAYIGESDQALGKRISQYIKPGPSQVTNKKVCGENKKLQSIGDCLYLEYTEKVDCYNLSIKRERRLAERLIIAYYRPYLQ